MNNGITVDTEMNLIPCNMCLDTSIGQFGKDFTTYTEYKLFRKKTTVRQKMSFARKFPSKRCLICKYKKRCHGGCPILWRNYNFEDLMSFKKII